MRTTFLSASSARGPVRVAWALVLALWGCRGSGGSAAGDAALDAARDTPATDASADLTIGDDATTDVSQPIDAATGDVTIDVTADVTITDDAPSDASVADAAADAVIADAAVDAVIADAVIALDVIVVDAGAPDVPSATDSGVDVRTDSAAPVDVLGGLVDVPPLPDVDLSGLPRDDAGRIILGSTGEGSLVLEETDAGPVQALARCSVLVTNCVSPGARTLDQCFASVRRCETDAPWAEAPCCPSACVTAYQTRRASGAGPITAYDQALFGPPSCVPGIPDLGGL